MKDILFLENVITNPNTGYGYTSEMLVPQLINSGLNIVKQSDNAEYIKEIIKIQRDLNIGYQYIEWSKADIVISHCTPDTFMESKSNYTIGFTYWEQNKLPSRWIDSCNKMNEIWTVSAEMKNVFINSGITRPVYDFKLGVDPSVFYPKKRSVGEQFVFMSMGSPSTRKNSQMAVDAFLRLFRGNAAYKLIYKTSGPADARILQGKTMISSIYDHPQIEVIDHLLSVEELGLFYDRANCLLYPTAGEGWGLIPFQAIAKGIPTICTNALACTEFANMSVPLDYSWTYRNCNGIYSNAGMFAEPNFDDLCDKMLYVVNNYEQVSNKTFESSKYINKNMTWEHVSKEYSDRLWQILKNTKSHLF